MIDRPKEEPIHETLTRARAMIDTPEKWIQGYAAQSDLETNEVIARSADNAVDHACRRAWDEHERIVDPLIVRAALRHVVNAHRIAQGYGPVPGLSAWNDDPATDHATVLAMFDFAIKKHAGPK